MEQELYKEGLVAPEALASMEGDEPFANCNNNGSCNYSADAYKYVPSILKGTSRWVVWRLNNEGKKLPYDAKSGSMASSTNEQTWSSFSVAVDALQPGNYSGVGFEFAQDRAYTGLDLDHVLDDKGRLLPEYVWIVEQANTYTEVSPSGTGLHLIFMGPKPEGMAKCKAALPEGRMIEMYDHDRYFTITGKPYVTTDGEVFLDVNENPELLHRITDTYFKDNSEEQPRSLQYKRDFPLEVSDNEILERMFNSQHGADIQCLYKGDISKYNGDDSAADLALCNHLAYWTNCNALQMDSIFRTSALMRSKWDSPRGDSTYGAMTIQQAIDDVRVYVKTSMNSFASKTSSVSTVNKFKDVPSIFDNPYIEVTKTGTIREPVALALGWFLNEDQNFAGVRLETMSQTVTCEHGLPWDKSVKEWRPVDDNFLVEYFQKMYRTSEGALVRSDKYLRPAFSAFCARNSYDLLQEEIKHLPAWDGIPRKDNLFIDYLGAEDTPYVREVTSLLLHAALARAFQPGCKYDYVIVLQGKQGIGKSFLLSQLALRPEFFMDDLKNVHDKSAQEQIRGKWIVEVGELSGFKGARAENLKTFISSQKDTYRVPYDKRSQSFPRRCVMVGTTNSHEYLEDPTGNRRFLPIMCSATEASPELFKPQFKEHIQQVWAEAYEEYKQDPHKALILPEEARIEARAKQESVTVEDSWIGVIGEHLEKKSIGDLTCTREILQYALNFDPEKITTKECMHCSQIVRKHFPNWQQEPSNRNVPGFGHQRAFKRIE